MGIMHYSSISVWYPPKFHAYLNKTATIGFVWVSMTIWWAPCIILLSYNTWWPVGWYAYLKKAVDFADYLWYFTGCSTLCISPLLSSIHSNVTHAKMKLQFCLGVYNHLVDVMHYAFIFQWMIATDGLYIQTPLQICDNISCIQDLSRYLGLAALW